MGKEGQDKMDKAIYPTAYMKSVSESMRIFEDLHTLAHRWTQYNSDHCHMSFEAFLSANEPGRYERLIAIYHFVETQQR